jgi:hypothetical protein
MSKRLRDLIGVDIDELAGARLSAEIPVSAAVLNRLIAQRLPASAPVSSVVVEPFDGDRAVAHVRTRVALVPPLTIHLALESQPQLPSAPTLALRWTMGGAGPLSPFVGLAVGQLARLPPWLRVGGNRATVDVGALLRSYGLDEVLSRLTMLSVTTTDGRLVVAFELRA